MIFTFDNAASGNQIYQWDSGLYLEVTGNLVSEGGHTYAHFQHSASDEILSLEVEDGRVAIPNILLQTAGVFRVYCYVNDAEYGKTLVEQMFVIVERPMPPEYIYDPTPVITYPELVDLVDDLTALRDALSNVSASAETLPAGSAASAEATLSPDGLAFVFGIPQGATGSAGRGIVSIERVSRVGLVDRYQITYTDGTTWNYAVTNGAQGATGATGNGILKIEKVSTVGLVDTYRITFTSGNTYDYTVTNGADGEDGATGATGNGIASIAKTGSSGLVDTYTITYTNGQTTTFTVTNGADGAPGLGFSVDAQGNYVLGNPDGKIEISAANGVYFGSPVVLNDAPTDTYEAANKGYVDSALADKMDKANPTGTGALSINRKANTTVGDKSSCLGGRENEVTGYCATATGNSNIASGAHSFAEGQGTWGRHANAHAEGIGTETGRSEQHVFGRYNHKMATGLRVSGNGTSVNNKKNAEFLDDNGNLMLAGDVYVGCAADSTGGNKVATEAYVDAAIGAAIGGSY